MEVKEHDNGTQALEVTTGVLHSEADLAEKDDAHGVEEEVKLDYSHFSKKQLAELVKELARDANPVKAENTLREIKPLYEDIAEKEKAEARNRFLESGGIAEDFEYRGDEFDTLFDANARLIRDRKHQHLRQQDEQRNENLHKKQDLLEKMRALLDAPGSSNQYDQFQELQKQWKAIGQVAPAHAKTLWANYHALIDRFYDNQSIYFELKELDRKKNLEAKNELIAKAERLVSVESLRDAIKELNELHHEFKHIGPVPKDDKEAVWQRFKLASDAVYARRDEFVKKLQEELHINLAAKLKIAEDLLPFVDFKTDRIKEWNQKTLEILALQKTWEQIGGVPRAKAKDVNKKFWNAFKSFFHAKSIFFKKLDEERDANLKIKQELLAKAIELKDNTDWEKTTNDFKNLQQRWKEVGPVSEKIREKIFKEFKNTCDYFFEQRRTQQNKSENEQVQNLQQKEAICIALETAASDGSATQDKLAQLQAEFSAIGFVPRQAINTIRDRYSKALETYVANIVGLSDEQKAQFTLQTQLSELKNDPFADKKLQQKELAIRKKVGKVENDIALWRNNLEFFAKSKNAGSLRDEVNQKIKDAENELAELKKQLKLIRSAS
jgi:Domain of Unknown Function (DUF349)